jgi:enoyl-CoA hydratase
MPHIVGLGRALDLILTGREFDAAEGFTIGFVNRLVPAGEALAVAVDLAEQIAAAPWRGVVNDRMAVYEGLGGDLESALANEDQRGRDTIFADGFLDGVARFEDRSR